jgi:hypothetical protein
VVAGGALVYDANTLSWSYRLANADLATYLYTGMAITTYATASPAKVHALGIVVPDILPSTIATTLGTAGAGLTALGDTRLALLNTLALNRTTIATLASQTSFTLTAGSADNTAYVNCVCVIEDASTAAQKAIGIIGAYTGASKTVTLRSDPGIFPMQAGDTITILPFGTSFLAGLIGTALPAESVAGQDAAALGKFLDVPTPLLTAASAMRGTDGAYTGTPPTVGQIDTQLSTAHGAGAWGGGLAPSAASIADAVFDEMLAGHTMPGSFGHAAAICGGGPGDSPNTYTVTDSATGLPLEDVEVWATSDAAGTDQKAYGVSDAAGHVTFWLTPGVMYYIWREKAGFTFANPDPEVAV